MSRSSAGLVEGSGTSRPNDAWNRAADPPATSARVLTSVGQPKIISRGSSGWLRHRAFRVPR